MHVLVVDDEVSVCSAVAEYLREEGFDVTEANEGTQALAIVGKEGIDVSAVVTDVHMPEMNGLEMWERMKPLVSRECRVIFMSGIASRYFQDGWSFPGELLQKPFSFSLLLEKLAQRRIGR